MLELELNVEGIGAETFRFNKFIKLNIATTFYTYFEHLGVKSLSKYYSTLYFPSTFSDCKTKEDLQIFFFLQKALNFRPLFMVIVANTFKRRLCIQCTAFLLRQSTLSRASVKGLQTNFSVWFELSSRCRRKHFRAQTIFTLVGETEGSKAEHTMREKLFESRWKGRMEMNVTWAIAPTSIQQKRSQLQYTRAVILMYSLSQ